MRILAAGGASLGALKDPGGFLGRCYRRVTEDLILARALARLRGQIRPARGVRNNEATT